MDNLYNIGALSKQPQYKNRKSENMNGIQQKLPGLFHPQNNDLNLRRVQTGIKKKKKSISSHKFRESEQDSLPISIFQGKKSDFNITNKINKVAPMKITNKQSTNSRQHKPQMDLDSINDYSLNDSQIDKQNNSIKKIGSIELIDDDNVEKQFENKETKIGQKLTESTSKKIIIIVLVIMISIPVFTADTYLSKFNYYQNSIDSMQYIIGNEQSFIMENDAFVKQWDLLVNDLKDSFNMKLIKLQLNQKKSDDSVVVLKEFNTGVDLDVYRTYELESNYIFFLYNIC